MMRGPKKVSQATARILKRASVSFGIIGKEEFCCGEAVRRVGGGKGLSGRG